MKKQVVVIASGNTERAALPHLLRHLQAEGIELQEVVIPPHGRLTVDEVERLVKARWYYWKDWNAPSKFVVLLDVDGKTPEALLERLSALSDRLCDVPVPCLMAYAQWHLEAWFFADAKNLSRWLGRNVGAIDVSRPDEIINPKNHLKMLLGRIYTSRDAGEIAAILDPVTIGTSSPSFRSLLSSTRDGD